MKFFCKIVFITMIAAGGIFMANHEGFTNSYSEYSSTDPELNISMDYVPGWIYQETRGSYGSYAQVQFLGAVKNNFAPSIIVTVEPSAKVKVQPLTVKGVADDIVKKRMNFKDAQTVSSSDTKILGLPAVDMTVVYKQPDMMRSTDAKMVSIKERVVVFQKGDRFYTLRYVNPEQVFADFEKDFLHCIKSLSIKG